MATPYSDIYEAVIGLEVHAQLLTNSKLFVSDSVAFGAAPNTHISPITLAHPGTLPRLNQKAVELAIRIGLACGCEIERENYFARKHYFYPDLPKGYQLSQHTTPICKGGMVSIHTSEGSKTIRLNRIHMEEDAGKSMHDRYDDFSAIDYNRAGVPLVEIVSEPEMHTGEEAAAYLTAIRQLVRALGVCDGNMEEGSLRCDANISIRKKGDKTLGTKVEVKNLNSIRYLRKAIDFEVARMIAMKDNGEIILQQTRSFDASTETTFSIRTKEDADDYRYFADPDLPPFKVSEEMIESIRAALPELPEQRKKRFIHQYALSEYDAVLLTEDEAIVRYFESAASLSSSYKQIANWMIGPLKSEWQEEKSLEQILSPAQLVRLIELIEKKLVSHTAAVQQLFPALLKASDKDPFQLAGELNLLQERDTDTLQQLIDEVLEALAGKVAEYKKGKKGLIGLFTGEVMKKSGGKADPKLVQQLLTDSLQNV
jgi:aspartyl-tRNA(Asn)/glutamyl-tRNA(Gln) amidotransferase subunit B